MTLHTSADAPITCEYWDELCDEDGFLALGRNRYHCSYVIYKSGTFYYAENGTTGNLDYGGPNNQGGVSGTSASEVIQAAIDAVGDGGLIFIKKGTYTLTTTLLVTYDQTIIEGEGTKTAIRVATDISAFEMRGTYWRLKNMMIAIEYDGTTTPAILVTDITKAIAYSFIEGIEIYRPFSYGYDAATGIEFRSINAANSISSTHIINCWVLGGFRYGIYFNPIITGGWINANTVLNTWITNAQNGIFMTSPGGGGATGVANGNNFTNVIMQAHANTDRGFVVDGVRNTFLHCKVWDIGITKQSMEILASANDTHVAHCVLERILDNTTNSNIHSDGIFTPQAASTPAVGASPVTFGPYSYPTYIEVSGGTVTNITVRAVVSGLTHGGWMLYPGDTCIIVYAVVPVVKLWPQ